ncbi:MAG: hypothetical protein ACO3EY_03780 [Candidatus Nanopelagicales bacterium]
MTYWEKYISEGMTAAQKKKAAEKVIDDLTGKKKKDKKDKNKKKGKRSNYQKYLDQQLEFKVKKYEDQKKREIEKRKEQEKDKAKQALSSIKPQTISYKDPDATAHKKAIENLGSTALGIGKAIYHTMQARKKEKEGSKQPEKKEPGKPGRPKASGGDVQQVSVRDVTSGKKSNKKSSGNLTGTPERKKLVPSTKRLPPASKKIAPSGGTPYQAEPAPQRETGMSLGQRARRNPALKSALIKSRMENFSNWREEFLFEVENKTNKVEKEKIIDVMKGKNNIEMNPTVTEDHKEISSGKKKDDEGYMANVELDQMERAIKALRKKIKSADMQMPAWVQSKITRAADYIDTASEYMQSDEKISEEKEEQKYCRLCRKEESKGQCSYGPSMWEKYTISEMAPLVAALGRVALGAGARSAVTTGTRAAIASSAKDIAKEKLKSGVQNALDRAGQRVQSNKDSIDPQEGGATAYKKAFSNIVGEEVDKKKILMLMVLKALEDKKRKKNSQLINGIIGEDLELNEAEKSEMKCNKPKAESHGSGETGKSHVVKACSGGKEKLIRFGQLGVKGSPKKEGESKEYASRRHRFQTRHAKNIAKGKMSAAYWANKVKW